jgi:hypothetical protein
MVPLSDTYFANLTQDAGKDNVDIWEAEITRAESLRHSDVSQMDIMASRSTNPDLGTREEIVNLTTGQGPGAWIAIGVDIEDRQ